MQYLQGNEHYGFAVDLPVHSGDAAHSRRWQRAQLASLERYRGILCESAQPVLGNLFQGDTVRQLAVLGERGVRLGLAFHGSDLRDPDAHMSKEPLSHFALDPALTEQLRASTRRSREVIAASGLPVLVSTPDLLSEIESAEWLPVVIDPNLWRTDTEVLDHGGPLRVVHAPSHAGYKGSELIDGTLQRLHDGGLIDYRRVSGIPHAEMVTVYRDADVVLDQFRIGSYGVAACEALAAGRIVVSHVSEEVRNETVRRTGFELPIVEATPDILAEVLSGIASDPVRARRIARSGADYVAAWHDGAKSGAVLANWLDGTK